MQPPNFRFHKGKEKVCRLKKALYDLKQSPRAWFERFRLAMIKFWYTHCQSDHTLFVKHEQMKLTTLIVNVDDIVITGNDESKMKLLKT